MAIAGPEPGVPVGEFAMSEGPPQNLLGAVIRELWTSMLNVGTAIRLGDTSSKPRYCGTVVPAPQPLKTPSMVNEPDSINAGIINSNTAPEFENKTANGAPRIASSPTDPGSLMPKSKKPQEKC